MHFLEEDGEIFKYGETMVVVQLMCFGCRHRMQIQKNTVLKNKHAQSSISIVPKQPNVTLNQVSTYSILYK